MRLLIAAFALSSAAAFAEIEVHYIANAGVLVKSGNNKILFDPLADNGYGVYYLPPADIRQSVIAGEAPFDDVDAVFVSHVHGDHYSPDGILAMMRRNTELHLYGTNQVIDTLRDEADGSYQEVFERSIAIGGGRDAKPVAYTQDGITIEVVHIPHSGWPNRHAEIANLAFRITLEDGTTFVHLGDAIVQDEYFALHPGYWANGDVNVAFPPYWFFRSQNGRRILDERIGAQQSIGVHVPRNVATSPGGRPEGLRDVDIFTVPGETRRLD